MSKQIKIVSGPPAGFARLGKKTRSLGTTIDTIAKTLVQNDAYEVLESPLEFWIRCRDSATNSLDAATQLVATATSTNYDDIRVIDAVTRFENNLFGRGFYKNPLQISLQQAITMIGQIKHQQDPATRWHALSTAVFQAPKGNLARVLLEHVFPVLFTWYPGCRVEVYVHDPEFESRLSILRLMRVFASFDALDLYPDTPQSLMSWQHEWTPTFIQRLLDWSSLLTFPNISGMTIDLIGLTIHVSDDTVGTYVPPMFPLSLLDMKHSRSGFGEENDRMRFSSNQVSISHTGLHGRFCWTQPNDQYNVLADFISERGRRLLRALSDLTNYERDVGGDTHVDFLIAQEQLWTIGRILRRTLSLQSSESRWVNRLSVFEVADQWAELMLEWKPGANSVQHFKTLLSPRNGRNLVLNCLASLPPPWRDRFTITCNNVYDNIELTVKKSVWSSKKRSTAGVDVGTATKPDVEAWESFAANLLRDLRNTHHGYLPDGEKYPKARRRLILSTGEWAPDLTYLPSLWLLAFLADPKTFLGWPTRTGGW